VISARIARTAAVLRRMSIALGCVAALVLFSVALLIFRLTFGGADAWGGIAVFSVAVHFRLVSAGQGALLQGLRRIGELAR
jgi:PST family polysaccharide transporter